MSVDVTCPKCRNGFLLPRPIPRFYCLTCRAVVSLAPELPGAPPVQASWLALVILMLTMSPVLGMSCRQPERDETERAFMRYVGSLSAFWGPRAEADLRRVATPAHAATVTHPDAAARAIFSPYLQLVQVERVDADCDGARISATVATGYKPTLALARPVVVSVIRTDDGLKVAGVVGH
jgi:hypothetical protein